MSSKTPFSTALLVSSRVDVVVRVETLLEKCKWDPVESYWEREQTTKYKGYLRAFFEKHKKNQDMIHTFLQFFNSRPYDIPEVTGRWPCTFVIKQGGTEAYNEYNRDCTGRQQGRVEAKHQLPRSHACTGTMDIWNVEYGQNGQREFIEKMERAIQGSDGSYGFA